MRGKKTFKDRYQLTLQLEKEHFDHIRETAIQISAQQHKLITPSELIRQVAEQIYPIPKKDSELVSNCKNS
jgi:hypothetical protein